MAQTMKEILPKGEYKIKTVGPNREWEFNGNKMITDSIQLEGHEQYWVDVNRKSDSPVPQAGETLKGHVEQDDQGKYAPKFKKESSGNWSGGGGRSGGFSSPGAIWSTAIQTASHIVAGYYAASGKKPESITDYFSKVEMIAPKVNAAVDKLVAANPKPESKPADTASSEAGETQPAQAEAPANNTVVIDDIKDDELGDW